MLATRVARFGTTVFSEFSALAAAHGAVNLGQGFPDFDGPEPVKEAAIRAVRDGVSQYAIGAGARELRQAIAEHSARFHGMTVDPETMVTVTSGATEALMDVMLGLVDPGDEVVLFEPFFDCYEADVIIAGGVPRYVMLRPPDEQHATWWYDPDELAAAFNERTKLVVINTPNNPTGKVYTRAELEQIAALCHRWDAYVLADEVYEHIVFPPARHVRMATLPGMWERTITVSSGGKSFSLTGWKIGWAIAAPALRHAVQQAHQFVTFATAAPLQAAIAAALRLPDAYFAELVASYQRKRDALADALRGAGLKAHLPEGTYYSMAEIDGTGFTDDVEFCRHLTREIGVAAIPPSAFYGEQHRRFGQRFARFAFCKRDETLREAAARLGRMRAGR